MSRNREKNYRRKLSEALLGLKSLFAGPPNKAMLDLSDAGQYSKSCVTGRGRKRRRHPTSRVGSVNGWRRAQYALPLGNPAKRKRQANGEAAGSGAETWQQRRAHKNSSDQIAACVEHPSRDSSAHPNLSEQAKTNDTT